MKTIEEKKTSLFNEDEELLINITTTTILTMVESTIDLIPHTKIRKIMEQALSDCETVLDEEGNC